MIDERDILILGSLDINDGVNFFKLEGTDWGTLSFEREQRRKLRGVAGWGPQHRDGWIKVPALRIMVKPSTPGDSEELRALLRLLQSELVKDENTLTLVPRGMLTAVTLPVVGDPSDVPDDIRLTVTRSPVVEVNLWRAPYAYLTEVTTGPTTLTTPAVVDLTAMTGEYKTPLDMLFSAVVEENLTGLYVAYVPEEYAEWCDDLSWLVEAEDIGVFIDEQMMPETIPAADGALSVNWVQSPAGVEHVHALTGKYHIEDDAGAHDSYAESAVAIPVMAGVAYDIGATVAVTDRAGGYFYVSYLFETEHHAFQVAIKALGAVTAEATYTKNLPAQGENGTLKVKMWWDNCTGTCKATVKDWSILPTEASAGWPASATDADANPDAADNCIQTDHDDDEVSATIDTAAMPPGPIEVLVRADETTTGFELSHEFGDWTTLPVDYWTWLDLGPFMAPTRIGLKAAAAPLTVSLRPGAETDGEGMVDRYAFMPARWGFWKWERTTPATTVERIGETVYVDDLADLADVVGAAIEAKGGRLLIIAQGTTTGEATHAADLTLTHTPRLTLW